MSNHRIIRAHFKKADIVIHSAMEDLDFDEWIKPHKNKRGDDYFQALCREIVGQQLSGKAANAIHTRFLGLFEDNKVDPTQLLKVKDQKLRDVGMSWAKAKYVKNIAEAYLSGAVKFDKFNTLADEEIIKELTTIKGVGPWTAEMFLMFTLGRENIFSYGDLGLKKGFIKLYKIENPKKEDIEKVISRWSPYKSYGSITLWHSLDKE